MNKPMSCLVVFSVVYCVVFRQKLEKTRQKQTKTQEQQKTNKNLREKHEKKQDIQPTTRPRMNISQVPAGWAVFVVCCCCSRRFCLFCVFTRVVFAYTCKHSKRLGKNRTTKSLREKQKKHTKIQDILQPTTRPRINISQVPAGWAVFVVLLFFSKVCCFVLLICCFCCFCLVCVECLHV